MFMDMFDPRGMQLPSNLSPGENITLLCGSRWTTCAGLFIQLSDSTHKPIFREGRINVLQGKIPSPVWRKMWGGRWCCSWAEHLMADTALSPKKMTFLGNNNNYFFCQKKNEN